MGAGQYAQLPLGFYEAFRPRTIRTELYAQLHTMHSGEAATTGGHLPSQAQAEDRPAVSRRRRSRSPIACSKAARLRCS